MTTLRARLVLGVVLTLLMAGRALAGDLEILKIEGPLQAMPGAQIAEKLNVNVKNTSAYRVYDDVEVLVLLSKDRRVGSGALNHAASFKEDGVLTGGRSQCYLVPGNNRWIPFQSLVLPRDVKPGAYNLVAVAQPRDPKKMATGGRALGFWPIRVQDPGAAELVPFIKGPRLAVAGSSVKGDVRVSVKNAGKATARDVAVELRLSRDKEARGTGRTSTKFRDDQLLPGGRVVIPELAPGRMESVKFPGSLVIPLDTPGRDYFLLAVVDPQNKVPEQDETNDTAVHSLRVQPDLPELTGTIRIEGSSVAGPGDSLAGRVKVTVTNEGSEPVKGSFTVLVMLSVDSRVDERRARYSAEFRDDVVLHGGKATVTGLGPGQTKTVPITGALVIPPGTPRGSYYLAAGLDTDAVVEELNERNNAPLCPLTIR